MKKNSHHSLETRLKISAARVGQPSNAYKHGMRHSRFYRLYHHMLTRCGNPNTKNYKNWGGRGIQCEWESFQAFYDDMYKSYQEHIGKNGEKNTTLDRIDNSGNYNKPNCRWATYKQQAMNSRHNHVIEYKGKKMLLTEWAKEKGINRTTLSMRLGAYGWSIEKTLTRKAQKG